jgi:hypothetical protein
LRRRWLPFVQRHSVRCACAPSCNRGLMGKY